MINLDVKETPPSTETITVESPSLPKVRDTCDCKPTGYCLWCWCGLCCSLPTACCLGQKMGDKWSWLKYGIPGKLIFDLEFKF